MSISPDGRYWWDGRQWVAALSQDGRWRWNGTAWTPASGKAPRPAWARAIFGIGPVAAAIVTGVLFWIATNDLSSSLGHGLLVWAALVVVRLIDPVIAPVWRILGYVPGIFRWAAAVAVAAWFSIGQFGPGAQYHEVEHFQTALYASIALAYALFRPSRGVSGGKA